VNRGSSSRTPHALDNILSDDTDAVESLRRDLEAFQEKELEASQEYLTTLKKTHDKLKALAADKERQHAVVSEELDRLNQLCAEQQNGGQDDPLHKKAQELEDKLASLNRTVKDALVKRDIFSHMSLRLKKDFEELQREGRTIQGSLEKDQVELQALNLALQQAKQELKNEEEKFHSVQHRITERRTAQSERLKGIQKVIKDRTNMAERQEERKRLREEVLERSNHDAASHEEAKLKKMQVVRKVYSSMLEKRMSTEEEELNELEATFQHIKIVTGLSDVDEIVHKFLTRSEKAQQLEKDADDIRERIEELKKQNEAQKQIFEAMRAESQNTAGNRKAILEMEKSSQDLQDLKHQCEESKNRAYRSSVSLEELKSAIARFRSKIEGRVLEVPKNSELPDFLKELDIRLGAKMRSVAESLSHNEHARGLPSADGKKEVVPIAKLQSEHMTKLLYDKIMSTAPDSGPRNVRVNVRPNLADLNRRHRRGVLDGFYADFVEADAPEHDEQDSDGSDGEVDPYDQDGLVDRSMVKKISSLIVQRDNPKVTRKKKKREGGV